MTRSWGGYEESNPMKLCNCHRCQRRRYLAGCVESAIAALCIGCAVAAVLMLI